MIKTDKRTMKRWKKRYGHSGSGSSHTREAHESEVRRHFDKIKNKRKK